MIYLHEEDEYIGPFCSRKDAEQFIALIELFGGNREGIELVELDSKRQPSAAEKETIYQHLC